MNTSRKLALATIVVLAATLAFAQEKPKKGEPELRTVHGTVIDKEEVPVDSAVVYLKNAHSDDIITHISASDGQFRFSGLDLNIDYEIHAEKDGWSSSSHSISNFDSRKDFVLTLKLDHKKPEK